MCPVKALEDLQHGRRGGARAVFEHQDGSVLTAYQVQCEERPEGAERAQFGTHCFRIGSTTERSRLGFGEGEIKGLGRWQSSSTGERGPITLPERIGLGMDTELSCRGSP